MLLTNCQGNAITIAIGITSPCQSDYYQKDKNSNCWQEYVEKAIDVYSWWECKLIQPLWSSLKKIKNRTTIWSSNSTITLLGIYPPKNTTKQDKKQTNKTWIQIYICIPMFIAALFIIPKCEDNQSVHSWMSWWRKCEIHRISILECVYVCVCVRVKSVWEKSSCY